jgi:hypothetical protein
VLDGHGVQRDVTREDEEAAIPRGAARVAAVDRMSAAHDGQRRPGVEVHGRQVLAEREIAAERDRVGIARPGIDAPLIDRGEDVVQPGEIAGSAAGLAGDREIEVRHVRAPSGATSARIAAGAR